jgi:Myb-like DNA-binding domain
MIKGGIWKNIEDEILKAAVMKYGLNQWSRISSLLVRKSAKQCKARWYEWLDPSIKKTEWSKEEEEKLLHLAKLFPNQWRTIAPGIGRTPSQCIEHYEKLLEEAAGKEVDEEDDPRKLKPGEIDPAPETRPPRPDPVDMDEDEKEMLQEARARLSNTRGKKAKRKMREKQLEEGRRLATVQRKRELRASGIDMELKKRIKPKVREMDYNIEIPFEHMVPEGKFKPEETTLPTRDELMISSQHIEGSMRSEQEAKKKIEDERRIKRLKELNLPEAITKINNLNQFKAPKKRSKLSLPSPQLTEIEVNNFSKMVNQSDNDKVTDILIANVEKTQSLLNPENIITPQGESTVQLEAYNALMLSRSSTPLIGGFNYTLNSEVSPIYTPNLIAKNLTPNIHSINISNPIKPLKHESVSSYLDLLPKPENEYDYQMDDNIAEDPESESENFEGSAETLEKILDSSVVKKKLPRPYVFNPKRYLQGEEDDLVSDEVVNLVLYDMHNHPAKGAKPLPISVDKELLEHDSLKQAQKLINQSMQEYHLLDFDQAHKQYIFNYKLKSALKSDENTQEIAVENAKIEFKYTSAYINKLRKKISELENKVKEKTKDLQVKAHKIEKSIKKKYHFYDNLRVQNIVFNKIKDIEDLSIQSRLEKLRKMVVSQSIKEKELSEELQNTTKSISAWEWCNST